MPPMLPRAESRAVRMFNGLDKTVRVARRLDGRINNLHLLSGNNNGQSLPASTVEWQDHPDTQLLLLRRDRLIGIQEEIAAYHTALTAVEAHITVEERLEAMKNLANLRMQEERELTAMSNKLDMLRSQSNKHWSMVAKMLTDLAKLKQAAKLFYDRLEFDKQEQSGLSMDERAVIEAVGPISSEREAL